MVYYYLPIIRSIALSLDIGGAVYNHWGKETCDAAGAEVLYKGIIVSSDHGKGGAASIICFTGEPQEEEDTKNFKRHHRYYSKVAPLYMNGRNISDNEAISCAKCFVDERTSPTVFAGRTTCPSEWTLEYRGYIMSKDIKSRKGDLICVDIDSRPSNLEVLVSARTDKPNYISDVKLSCGTLPCNKYENNKLLPCVVCTY